MKLLWLSSQHNMQRGHRPSIKTYLLWLCFNNYLQTKQSGFRWAIICRPQHFTVKVLKTGYISKFYVLIP